MALSLWNGIKGRLGAGGIAFVVIMVLALGFIAANLLSDARRPPVDLSVGSRFPCTVLSVYDGDGPINCAEVDARGQQVIVRLRGIEARENDNSCRREDICPPLSGAQGRAVLEELAGARMLCTSFGPSYNRVDSRCHTPGGVDISCEMIRRGAAMRWPEYDREGSLANCAPPRR